MNMPPETYEQITPITATAYEYPRLLCSQLGIHTRPSPLAPKMKRAMVPDSAEIKSLAVKKSFSNKMNEFSGYSY